MSLLPRQQTIATSHEDGYLQLRCSHFAIFLAKEQAWLCKRRTGCTHQLFRVPTDQQGSGLNRGCPNKYHSVFLCGDLVRIKKEEGEGKGKEKGIGGQAEEEGEEVYIMLHFISL